MAQRRLRYLSGASLHRLDGRTREARMLDDVRRELLRQVGANPSPTVRRLVEQVAQLSLQAALVERRFAEKGEITDAERWLYANLCNSQAKLLGLLGMGDRSPRLPGGEVDPAASLRALLADDPAVPAEVAA